MVQKVYDISRHPVNRGAVGMETTQVRLPPLLQMSANVCKRMQMQTWSNILRQHLHTLDNADITPNKHISIYSLATPPRAISKKHRGYCSIKVV